MIVSLEKPPLHELAHYGVLGMKWGIRKSRNSTPSESLLTLKTKTKTGATLELNQRHTPAFARFMSKHNKKVRETLRNSKSFKIQKDGKQIGELDLYKERSDSLNIVWVTIDHSEEGKGYGTAVMKAAIAYARKTKCTQVTLEVPGESPNARHIYEKLGFKATDDALIGDQSDVWGGLTKMQLDLNKGGV